MRDAWDDVHGTSDACDVRDVCDDDDDVCDADDVCGDDDFCGDDDVCGDDYDVSDDSNISDVRDASCNKAILSEEGQNTSVELFTRKRCLNIDLAMYWLLSQYEHY